MALNGMRVLPGRDVPEFDASVAVGRGERLAVGAELHGIDAV